MWYNSSITYQALNYIGMYGCDTGIQTNKPLKLFVQIQPHLFQIELLGLSERMYFTVLEWCIEKYFSVPFSERFYTKFMRFFQMVLTAKGLFQKIVTFWDCFLLLQVTESILVNQHWIQPVITNRQFLMQINHTDTFDVSTTLQMLLNILWLILAKFTDHTQNQPWTCDQLQSARQNGNKVSTSQTTFLGLLVHCQDETRGNKAATQVKQSSGFFH